MPHCIRIVLLLLRGTENRHHEERSEVVISPFGYWNDRGDPHIYHCPGLRSFLNDCGILYCQEFLPIRHFRRERVPDGTEHMRRKKA